MKRLYYLDNLRTACMLFGVFVHATTLGDFGRLEFFATVSDKFRMATFFVITGFLAVMLVERRGTRGFLHNRIRSLAIPLASSLILLNPITLWLVFGLHNGATHPDFGWGDVWAAVAGAQQAEGPMIWHLHLWFLFSLLWFVLTMPALLPLMRKLACSRLVSFLTGQGTRFAALILALAVTAGVIAALVVLQVLGQSFNEFYIFRASLTYWPYFILGMLLFLSPELLKNAARIDLPLLGVVVAMYILGELAELPDAVSGAINQSAKALLRCWVFFTLLFLSMRFLDRTGPLLSGLARSIYTIYLFHYVILYALATLYAQVFPIDNFGFFVLSFATMILGYLLHILLVERVPLLNLLFNGKPYPRTVSTGEERHT